MRAHKNRVQLSSQGQKGLAPLFCIRGDGSYNNYEANLSAIMVHAHQSCYSLRDIKHSRVFWANRGITPSQKCSTILSNLFYLRTTS